MTNETKHTPTPWNQLNGVFTPEDGYFSMVQTPNQCIANVFDEADAAHIVKCVNMHDELVEALKAAHNGVVSYSRDDKEATTTMIRETLKKAGAL